MRATMPPVTKPDREATRGTMGEDEIAARARHAVIVGEILTLAETARLSVAEARPDQGAIRRACAEGFTAIALELIGLREAL